MFEPPPNAPQRKEQSRLWLNRDSVFPAFGTPDHHLQSLGEGDLANRRKSHNSRTDPESGFSHG